MAATQLSNDGHHKQDLSQIVKDALESQPLHVLCTLCSELGGEVFINYLVQADKNGVPAVCNATIKRPEGLGDIFKNFSEQDLEKILTVTDVHSNSMMRYTLTAATALSTVTMLYRRLGGKVIQFLLQKNNDGYSTLVAAMHTSSTMIGKMLKIFDDKELEQLVTDFSGEGFSTLHEIAIAEKGSGILSSLYQRIGPLKLVEFMHRENNKGVSTVVTLSRTKEGMARVLQVLDSDATERLLTAVDDEGRTSLHHIMLSDGGVDLLRRIYEKIGGERIVRLLSQVDHDIIPTFARMIMMKPQEIGQIFDLFKRQEMRQLLCTNDLFDCRPMDLLLQCEDAVARFHSIFQICTRDVFLVIFEAIMEAIPLLQPTKLLADVHRVALMRLEFWCNGDSSFREEASKLLQESFEKLPSVWREERRRVNWIINQISKDCYVLSGKPSILLISNRRKRTKYAKEEAESLRDALEFLGLRVEYETNLSTAQTFSAIKRMQLMEESKVCQILIMMSHGAAGHIRDDEGKPIPLEMLERMMSPKSHSNTPKVLILQCCQTIDHSLSSPQFSLNGHQDADPSRTQLRIPQVRYAPQNPDFSVMISCVNGTVSYRNEFIPKLAEEIRNLKEDQDLHSAFVAAHRALKVEQTPIHHNTMRYHFCLKNVYSMSANQSEISTCTIS